MPRRAWTTNVYGKNQMRKIQEKKKYKKNFQTVTDFC